MYSQTLCAPRDEMASELMSHCLCVYNADISLVSFMSPLLSRLSLQLFQTETKIQIVLYRLQQTTPKQCMENVASSFAQAEAEAEARHATS